MAELFLIFMTFVASTTAAMVGLGGGILLISVMPGLIPPFAIIPVHGMVQIANNFTRVLFGLRHVVAGIVPGNHINDQSLGIGANGHLGTDGAA